MVSYCGVWCYLQQSHSDNLVAVSGNLIPVLHSLALSLPPSYRSVRTAGNLLIISLSLADLLMLLKNFIIINNFYRGPQHLGVLAAKVGDMTFLVVFCSTTVPQLYGSASVVSGMAAIWSLMSLTVERAMVLCLPGYHRTKRTSIQRLVLTIWCAAVLASLPPLLGWNKYVYEVKDFLLSLIL